MHNIYLKDLIRICNGKLMQGNLDEALINFSKDTRTMAKGSIYVGIKGEVIDGDIYYEEALEKGCLGCILNDDANINKDIINKYPNAFIVLVKDTVKCLQELAKYKRSLYDIPVVAITGSVGKTSTKDIIASVLSKKYKVLKTLGNYNNEIGLPLTILSLKAEDCLVLEMGMNHFGEIRNLTAIAKPTVAVITTIGTSHIGNLGSRENILKAKLEILEGMDKKTLIINNDNDLLNAFYLNNKDKIDFYTYGLTSVSLYKPYNIINNELNSTYDINIDNNIYNVKVNVPGNHFVLNSLAGIAVGRYLGVPINDIVAALSNFELTKKRMEIEKINDITLINDAYNASLDSMASALSYLGSLKDTRKIAILGDMLELGDYSEYLHREVGKCVYNNKIDILIIMGSDSKYIKDEVIKLGFNKDNVYEFKQKEDLVDHLFKTIKPNDTLLFKASFGMKFYELYNTVKEKLNS